MSLATGRGPTKEATRDNDAAEEASAKEATAEEVTSGCRVGPTALIRRVLGAAATAQGLEGSTRLATAELATTTVPTLLRGPTGFYPLGTVPTSTHAGASNVGNGHSGLLSASRTGNVLLN